ncbi:MAG: hypothetical protein V2A58_10400 [Planctomycetota bacterium]
MPARSAKTYFIYMDLDFADKKPAPVATELRRALATPSGYAHKLDIRIGAPQERINVDASIAGGKIHAGVRAYAAQSVEARLISPDGAREIPLPLEQASSDAHMWTLPDGFALPTYAPPGVWQMRVVTTDSQGKNDDKAVALPAGFCMWCAPLVEKVLPRDRPEYGRDWAKLCAARNEQEAFQVFLETDADLSGVALSITELTRRDAHATIDGSNVTIQLVQEVGCPSVEEGLPAGPYPDASLPWHTRDIARGTRKCALVTVHVPPSAEPGEYWATLTATAHEGAQAQLPVTLEVFDFELPARLAFKPVFWADNFRGAPRKGSVVTDDRRALYDRNNPDGAVLELARLLAACNGTAFYSHHDKAPYAVPWHWDPETHQASFNFTWLDRNAKLMLEELGHCYLCFGGKFRPAGPRIGTVWDWDPDLTKAMTYDGEMALPKNKAKLDTDEGKEMYRAYCRGIAEHLKEKGWLDKSFLYVCDETDRGAPSEIAAWCAESTHEAGLKTFAASLAWDWPVYMSDIDAFTGGVSPDSFQRILKEGNQWWGSYNRPCFMSQPLANTRLLGVESFFRGSSHYCTYFLAYPEIWIDTADHYPVPANAGYPYGEFIEGARLDNSFFSWVYPYPSWEPVSGSDPAPPFVPSLRLVALREAVEDYEYLRLLAEVDKTQRNDAQGGRPARDLLEEMQSLVRQSVRDDRQMHAQGVFFVADPVRFYELRRRIGREIAGREGPPR